MDDLYVLARRVLLDALEALGTHRDAAILVGAQAIYLHTGAAELAVAEYTTDADLALDPALLGEVPPIEQALQDAGFRRADERSVGVWKARAGPGEADVVVDLLVPSSVSPGQGRRAARLVGHHANAARKVVGLEGVLVDKVQLEVASLDPDADPRRFTMAVAGPAALLVAKLFKLHERVGTSRASDKDALDVLRLLRAVETDALAAGLDRIRTDSRSRPSAERAQELLGELFGTRGAEGAVMAARATQPLMDEMEIRLSCEALATDLIAAMT